MLRLGSDHPPLPTVIWKFWHKKYKINFWQNSDQSKSWIFLIFKGGKPNFLQLYGGLFFNKSRRWVLLCADPHLVWLLLQRWCCSEVVFVTSVKWCLICNQILDYDMAVMQTVYLILTDSLGPGLPHLPYYYCKHHHCQTPDLVQFFLLCSIMCKVILTKSKS